MSLSDSSNWLTSSTKRPKKGVPEGLWQRCPGCQAAIFRKQAEKALGVCPDSLPLNPEKLMEVYRG